MAAGLVRRYWPSIVVAAFVLAVAAVSEFGRVGLHPVSAQPITPDRPRPTVPPPTHHLQLSGGAWPVQVIRVISLSVIGVISLVLLYLLVQWLVLRRKQVVRRAAGPFTGPVRATDAGVEQQRQDVLDAVDAGLAELAAEGTDPREVVIACWVRLETVAQATGVDHRASSTPSDLVAHLSARHRVSTDTLASLADLYRDARYSRHVIAASMRETARAALHQLRGEIAATDRATA
jgi:hypothetical protein